MMQENKEKEGDLSKSDPAKSRVRDALGVFFGILEPRKIPQKKQGGAPVQRKKPTQFQRLGRPLLALPAIRHLWTSYKVLRGRLGVHQPTPNLPDPESIRAERREYQVCRVTVVVALHNKERHIRMCLESIVRQTYENWECIVVDDNSTDSSIRVVNEFIKKDSRFILIRHKCATGGPAAPRNTGLRHAKGELVTFLDADDFLQRESIKSRVNAYLASDRSYIAGSYCGTITVGENEDKISGWRSSPGLVKDFISSEGNCPFTVHSALTRVDVCKKFGGFDENKTIVEDWDLWSRIMRHGYAFVPTNKTGVAYRMNASESIAVSRAEEHLALSHELYMSAHEELADDEIVSGTPFVFRQPWLYYHCDITFAKRLATFSAMTEGNVHLERFIKTDSRRILHRYIHIAKHIEQGVLRKRGLAQVDNSNGGLKPYQLEISGQVEKFNKCLQEPTLFSPAHSTRSDVLKPGWQQNIDIVFFPHKDYHVNTFIEIASHLSTVGLKHLVVDSSYIYRDEGVPRALKHAQGIASISFNNFVLHGIKPKMVLVMNDWDPTITGPIVREANDEGILTVGIVEGVQDFLDVDTGRTRNPYRSVKAVLLSGEHDRQFFDETQTLVVGGVPRLDSLMAETPHFPEAPLVAINVNFSYGVLVEKREEWLSSILDVCQQLNLDYIITQHPADKSDLGAHHVADDSMYDVIRRSSVFVSRFGSGIIEALAMGKPAIYFNPHGEKVRKFQDHFGAYPTCDNRESLASAINDQIRHPGDVRGKAVEFLKHHTGYSGDQPISRRTADALCFLLGGIDASQNAKTDHRSTIAKNAKWNDGFVVR